MELALLIAIVVTLTILGLWGLRRGVARGLLTLVGTLLGAALVELWFNPSTGREGLEQQFRPETLDTPALLTVMAVFLVVAIIVGYGSGLLLRQPKAEPVEKLTVRNRIVGSLVGVLNGALIASYLLHYAVALLPDFASALAGSLPLRVLYAWLPWYVLAVVLVAGAWIVAKAVMRVAQLASRASAAERAETAERASSKAAAARGQADRLQSVSDKIDSHLRDTTRK
jgi:hypothetical protein